MTSVGSSHTGIGVHRRKTSRDEDDNVLVFPADDQSTPSVSLAPPPKGNRVDARTNGPGDEHDASGSHLTSFKAEAVPQANGGEHGGWGARAHSAGSRSRVTSVPAVPSPLNGQFPAQRSPPSKPPSAGPYRTSFALPRASTTNGAFPHGHASNGHGRHQAPAMRQSFSLPVHSSHSRARSVSGPFTPSSPSPLAASFSISQSASYPPTQGSDGNGLVRFPEHTGHLDSDPVPSSLSRKGPFSWGDDVSPLPAPNIQSHTRRHSRLHSRNLSIFFPRPGSLPSTAIDEDGNNEVEADASYLGDDGVLIPLVTSPSPEQHTFRQGFTFGAKPPPDADSNGFTPLPPAGPARRGHHHKHSLSHNFFSFLEPGGVPGDLRSQPTPTPLSPWNPISPFPFQTSTSSSSLDRISPVEGTNGIGLGVHTAEKPPIAPVHAVPEIDLLATIAAVGQFILGATLWVVGQQIGSLSCTGLGYWVVFDAFGVGLAHVLPGYLARAETRAGMRRPYGNARIETLMTYAQSVYLLFASVYVCKETLEHLLLASGEGHHHHHGDELSSVIGIEFPPLLLSIALLSLICTAVMFNSQAKLVSATGNYVPPLYNLLPFRLRLSISSKTAYPSLIANLLSNPYTLAPILFCSSILCALAILPPRKHGSFDLLLAGVETVVTFALAYPAAVALGAVLLQTAPSRGLPGGRMEAFLRAMREIERHSNVLHLPAPHFWQLTPHLSRPSYIPSLVKWDGPAQSLVVTLELHVPRDLTDDDLLKLTAWASERCKTALRYGSREGGGEGEADVTIGVVRG
ncbi:uncharacterized protein PHACADRAFT_207827 [Phanerochaete carnosa HHB-10118-sp]|uniref:Uncharacterized protein n=1 Tax=Phanerochaete carnosa (strain HHB-10118-sp) TaxID=650164 RepID=K5WBM7_PHACS|nr:uncharacterized protein PHACADRAFT_207827 [Phanerochaete carnosa HHB-10118-sp]EKM56625.1 hypothetical protein PHACADRAFT_207827 [Phanerochaete carnosa HHB-10118-sp]